MAKDKASGPSGGGSRAAKKRRKVKGRATPAPPPAAAVVPHEQPETTNKRPHHVLPPPSKAQSANKVTTAASKANGKASGKYDSGADGRGALGGGSSASTTYGTEPSGASKRERYAGSSDTAHADGDAPPIPGDGSSSSSSSSRRGRHTGVAQGAPTPAVIDASVADDRSRLLLELDAKGVLADADVESGLKARQLLQWMVAPLPVEEFYDSYWERNAFVVRGRSADYFSGWLETADLESFVSNQSMQYGVDLDVTNYVNKCRVTLNPPPPAPTGGGDSAAAGGKRSASSAGGAKGAGNDSEGPAEAGGAVVTSKFVWEKFRQGCSLRMPCPQKYSDPLHRLLSALEEEFGCMVGSNVYLTPPRNQGFAPHWDDIEAFLLQVEGRKRWRVYPPASEDATLPRLSSPNLTDEQAGKPALDVVLEPGDLLYFPRGWIHQAETVGDEPSLHITVSAMQGNCWADLVEGVVPQAVASAVQANLGLRSGLPRDYLEYMGVVHSDEAEDPRRERFKARMRKHLGVIVEEAFELLDAAADQMGKRYISDRLPPVLEEAEEAASVMAKNDEPITPLTKLRLARRGCARLVLEDGVAVVYHCMDNSRVHHGNALSPLQFELDDAPAIEALLSAYPDPVRVFDLPHPPAEDLEEKVGVATALFKEGFLLVMEDEEDDSSSGGEGATGGGGARAGSAMEAENGAEEEDEEEDGL